VEHAFWGQWIIVALAILGGLGGLAAVASYFATRRELIALEVRVTRVEGEAKDDRRDNQVHASERSRTIFIEMKETRDKLESRINPLVENTAGLKASHEAFVTAFTNQTEVLRAMVDACNRCNEGKK
jgi:NCAIR mutase (PurE)-related protein